MGGGAVADDVAVVLYATFAAGGRIRVVSTNAGFGKKMGGGAVADDMAVALYAAADTDADELSPPPGRFSIGATWLLRLPSSFVLSRFFFLQQQK
jgi:hypothetical protein